MENADTERLTEWINREPNVSSDVSFQTNAIYCGDCAEVMNRFPEECVDLIYVDPPFFSNQQYEILWDDGYETRAFQDRWKGGIQNYVAWMEPKLTQCHKVLKSTGSMYLHCDWHAVHHLRVLMERIFGENNFRSEIIWQRTSSHNDPKNFGNIADYILYFAKSDKYTWNPQYTQFSQEYIDKWYRNVDENGRRYMSDNLVSPHPRPNLTYEYKGYKPHEYGWKVSLELMKQLDAEGRLIFPKDKNGRIRRKIYLDSSKGLPLQNLWTDITPLHSQSKERLGYPTQKPEALLERIINASSNPTDIVLDPMCGCGTAIAASFKLGRRWVGIDISPTACKLMAKRMRALRAKVGEPIGLPKTVAALRELQPFEFQNWVFEKLHGRVNPRKVGDMGIDGWVDLDVPCQVKQSEDVGRNVVDNFETAIQRADKDRGVIVAFSFGRGAHEEVARAKNEMGLDIKLKTVEEILKET
jgi:DNA modification methylase